MASKIYTRVVAIVLLLVGACAFVPPLNGGPSPNTVQDLSIKLHGENLFWKMPMNYLLAGILIGFGISGLLTSRDVRASRLWCRIVVVVSLVFMFVGLCPAPLGTVGGFLPLTIWTTGFFLILAVFTFYYAFFDGPLPDAMTKPVFRQ